MCGSLKNIKEIGVAEVSKEGEKDEVSSRGN